MPNNVPEGDEHVVSKHNIHFCIGYQHDAEFAPDCLSGCSMLLNSRKVFVFDAVCGFVPVRRGAYTFFSILRFFVVAIQEPIFTNRSSSYEKRYRFQVSECNSLLLIPLHSCFYSVRSIA